MDDFEIRAKVVSVVQQHMPGLKIDEAVAFSLHPKSLLSADSELFFDESEQGRVLKDLEEQLFKLWASYRELHPSIRDEFERKCRDNKDEGESTEKIEFFTKSRRLNEEGEQEEFWEPYFEHRPFGHMLGRLFNFSTSIDESLPNTGLDNRVNSKASAFKSAKQHFAGLKATSSKEREHETISKAVLVARLRKLWSSQIGRPPRKPSPGSKFFNFVGDVISALQKEWDTEATINAWYNRQDAMDSYGPRS